MSRHYPHCRRLSLLSIACIVFLTGCERYAVTLNERPIYTPKVIYSGYNIIDPGLANCVKQALTEGKITQPEGLEILNCSFAGVTDLSGIELFSQLKTVNLNSNQLTDIKELLFLGKLRQVNLSENPSLNCTDIEALEELLENATIAASACIKPL
jgi:Leucine-rich repeat (LRR) protein